MADFELEALLAPLQADAPCGSNLEYDPAFLALEAAGSGRPEQQYGDTIIPAQEPDWLAVRQHALALAQRTRDLRVAVWLVRSGARLHGWQGAACGLQIVQGLLERHWSHVHPQLDASDGNDPTARLNALQPLVHASAGLADLRAAALTSQRGGPRVRDVELAFSHADAQPGEESLTEEALVEAVAVLDGGAPALVEQLHNGVRAVHAIAAAVAQHAGAVAGPDFTPLMRLLKPVSALATQLQGSIATPPVELGAAPAASAPLPTAGAMASREDVLRALQRACEWIERNEPSNPAPLLIRRAQRLMSKNFLDIIRDLVPDGLREVEKLAGVINE